MTTNKKITLGASAAMVLSVFLPYMTMGPESASLFDVIMHDPATKVTLVLLFAIGALVTAFLDKAKISRICSGVVLAMMLYALYEMTQLPSLGDVSVFDFIDFGFYVTIIASIVGVIFSKDD
jgi:hypothetical protein